MTSGVREGFGQVRSSRVRNWAAAWLTAYLPRLALRRPQVHIALGPWLPCWGLRLALGVLALLCAAMVVRSPLAWVGLILLAIAVVVRPSGIAPAALIMAVALSMAVGPEGTALRTALLIIGLHAVAQLGILLGRASWTARVEIGALAVPLRRFLGIQAFVQPLALVGGGLAGWDLGLALLPLIAVLGLAVVSYVWLPSLGDDRSS